MKEIFGSHLVGEEWTAGKESCFHAINPKSGEQLQPGFCQATASVIDLAATLAERDFAAFMQAGSGRRAQLLDSIAEELHACREPLLARAMLETALPAGRLEGELQRTINQLQQFARLIEAGHHLQEWTDPAIPDRQPLPRPELRLTKIPLGPVAVFGASNFPLAFSVAGGDTAAALAAGCPVLVKAHPAHPGTCELAGKAIVRALERCGLPRGIFALLQGAADETGAALVRHPLIRAVAFTGSRRAGRALYDLAAARPEPIPLFAEMGSVNPVFVLPHSMRQNGAALAQSYVESVCLGGGQFCTNPGLLVGVVGPELDDFVAQVQRVARLQPVATLLTPAIRQGYLQGLEGLRKHPAVSPLVDLLSLPAGGCDVPPVFLQVAAADAIPAPQLFEEVFGPVSLLVRCDSVTQMQQLAAMLPGQLTASVHATDGEAQDCRQLVSLLQRKAGRLLLNGFPTGVEVCHAMVHGGPWPATTDSRFTSVGTAAIERFLRPLCLQGFSTTYLPDALA